MRGRDAAAARIFASCSSTGTTAAERLDRVPVGRTPEESALMAPGIAATGPNNALAISGAAASPNMGYHSSKLLSLLMSLFNIRLGMWLPNPASPDPKHVRKADHPFRIQAERSLLRAAF